MLSAFALSIVLVPALAAILGRGAWWPVRPGRDRGRHHAGPPAARPHPGHVSLP
ncbi:hypothetical protein [Streptomyces syringium]|uniref:hypothetical protein n=1 Tax=Streptomyces syringium TaxID=76729 RepID=UPI0033D99097